MTEEPTTTGTDPIGTASVAPEDDYEYYTWGRGVSYEVGPVTFVYIIGCTGVLTNGLGLATIMKFKELRKHTANTLILNQTVADLVASFLLVITYALWILMDTRLSGAIGVALCHLFMKEQVFWMAFSVSAFNLVALTFERYLLVVHPISHRIHFKKSHLYLGIVIVWATPFFYNIPDTTLRTHVDNGWCRWTNAMDDDDARVYSFIYFVGTFLLPLLLLVYCYGHMLVAIRRQIKRVAPEAGKGKKEGADVKLSGTQRNLTKTMAIVAGAFVVCLLPFQIYYIMWSGFHWKWSGPVYYPLLCLSLINLAINPVIYVFTMEKYRRALLALFTKKTSLQSTMAEATQTLAV